MLEVQEVEQDKDVFLLQILEPQNQVDQLINQVNQEYQEVQDLEMQVVEVKH